MTSDTVGAESPARTTRELRGSFVKDRLDEDGRSARFVASRIGISNSAMSDRLKGKAPFLADELENIASVLKTDPLAFYAAYISVGATQKAPTPKGGGLDVHPLGLEPRTH